MTEEIKAPTDWPEIIVQWQMSGLDKKAFCLEQQLNYKTFLKHCKRAPEIMSAAATTDDSITSTLPSFIPVQLKSSDDKLASPPLSLILNKRFKLEILVESAQTLVLNTLFKALGVLA